MQHTIFLVQAEQNNFLKHITVTKINVETDLQC